MNKYATLIREIESRLDGARFRHSLSVAKTAAALGKDFSLTENDCERLYIAGLLHDITKPLKTPEQIELCHREGFPLTDDDIASPQVLHAITGALVAKRDFPEIADREICQAIAKHTTGSSEMTLFEKLIYLADYIEPERQNPVCIAAREAFYTELSQSDDKLTTLNRHLLTVTEGTKRYVLAKNQPLHPKTEDMILFLQKELKQ